MEAPQCAVAGCLQGPTTDASTGNGVGLVTGDLNNDCVDDVVLYSNSSSVLRVRLGNPDGTLQDAIDQVSLGEVFNSVLLDANSDGKLDLAYSLTNQGLVRVRLGLGDGTFEATDTPIHTTGTEANIGGATVAAANLNGDALTDLIVQVAFGSPPYLRAYLNKGDGTFTYVPISDKDQPVNAGSISFGGDFNDDGRGDAIYLDPGSGVRFFLGKEGGGFDFSVDTTNLYNSHGAVADLDGDGVADFVTGDQYDGNKGKVLVYWGDASFPATQTSFLLGVPVWGIAASDVNRDGTPDLVFTGHDAASDSGGKNYGRSYVVLNTKKRTFASPVSIGGEPDLFNIAVFKAGNAASIAGLRANADGGLTLWTPQLR